MYGLPKRSWTKSLRLAASHDSSADNTEPFNLARGKIRALVDLTLVTVKENRVYLIRPAYIPIIPLLHGGGPT